MNDLIERERKKTATRQSQKTKKNKRPREHCFSSSFPSLKKKEETDTNGLSLLARPTGDDDAPLQGNRDAAGLGVCCDVFFLFFFAIGDDNDVDDESKDNPSSLSSRCFEPSSLLSPPRRCCCYRL